MKFVLPIFLFCFKFAFSQLTLVVDVPASTPAQDEIFIAGNFQGWNPGDRAYRLSKSPNPRQFLIDLNVGTGDIEFKFTRGNWQKVESTALGGPLPNRKANISHLDTLYLVIEGWEDTFSPSSPLSTASKNVQILSDSFYIPQLDRYRRIWIYLPPGYDTKKKSYPVLYMLDGQNLFDRAIAFSGEWQVDESMNELAKSGQPLAIVVAVDNGGSHRTAEYTPWPNKKYGGGDGGKTLEFIVEDLKPYVDKFFRTKKSQANTGLMGSSLGGLMATYAGLKYSKVFGKIASFSPAYWINPEVFELAQEQTLSNRVRFYQIMGVPEGKSNIDNMLKMDAILKGKDSGKWIIKSRTDEVGQHNEAFWARAFQEAYLYLFLN